MEIHFFATYAGLVEGVPSERLNDAIIDGLPDRAGRLLPAAPVHVVPPARTYPDDDADRPLAFGRHELLPPVIVSARLHSGPVRGDADPVLEYSRLVVVWFQADAVIPVEGTVPDVLDQLDWEALAEDDEI